MFLSIFPKLNITKETTLIPDNHLKYASIALNHTECNDNAKFADVDEIIKSRQIASQSVVQQKEGAGVILGGPGEHISGQAGSDGN